MYTVRDILREKGAQMYTTSPQTTVYEALKVMNDNNVGALLVFEKEEMVGIISERDYARKMIIKGKYSQDTPVRDIMTTQVITVTPDQNLEACMELISGKRIRHLPVVEETRVVGIISIGDIVKGIISHKESVIEQLEKYIKGQR
jgi:CBS domain-containing protein